MQNPKNTSAVQNHALSLRSVIWCCLRILNPDATVTIHHRLRQLKGLSAKLLAGMTQHQSQPLGGKVDSKNKFCGQVRRGSEFPQAGDGEPLLSSVTQSVEDIKEGQQTLCNQTCLLRESSLCRLAQSEPKSVNWALVIRLSCQEERCALIWSICSCREQNIPECQNGNQIPLKKKKKTKLVFKASMYHAASLGCCLSEVFMQFDHRNEGRLAKCLHLCCLCTTVAVEITGFYLKNKSLHWTHALHQHSQAPNLLLIEFPAKQQEIEIKWEVVLIETHIKPLYPEGPTPYPLTVLTLFSGKTREEVWPHPAHSRPSGSKIHLWFLRTMGKEQCLRTEIKANIIAEIMLMNKNLVKAVIWTMYF